MVKLIKNRLDIEDEYLIINATTEHEAETLLTEEVQKKHRKQPIKP